MPAARQRIGRDGDQRGAEQRQALLLGADGEGHFEAVISRHVGVHLNRPGFVGGSHAQISWNHEKPDDEQILFGSPRAGGAEGFRYERDHPSRWAVIFSIAGKIDCSPHIAEELRNL